MKPIIPEAAQALEMSRAADVQAATRQRLEAVAAWEIGSATRNGQTEARFMVGTDGAELPWIVEQLRTRGYRVSVIAARLGRPAYVAISWGEAS